jgi:hypothetical protein
MHSLLGLDKRAKTMGATSLDRVLISNEITPGFVGFAADVKATLHKRADFLVKHSLAKWKGDRLMTLRDLYQRCDGAK